MREIRLYGSEGGGAVGSSYPYKVFCDRVSCIPKIRRSQPWLEKPITLLLTIILTPKATTIVFPIRDTVNF